jgi:hypothetical protein
MTDHIALLNIQGLFEAVAEDARLHSELRSVLSRVVTEEVIAALDG